MRNRYCQEHQVVNAIHSSLLMAIDTSSTGRVVCILLLRNTIETRTTNDTNDRYI